VSKRPDLSVDEVTPTAEELAELVRRVSAANPDTYFLHLTREKLRWLVLENSFRDRRTLAFRAGGELTGLAIIERQANGFASLSELLVSDRSRLAHHVRALTRALTRLGFGGLHCFGNAANSYVASLRRELRRAGSVPLRGAAQLVIRGASRDPADHPPASALAMTGLWAPPA
jgi:hypothetical protein